MKRIKRFVLRWLGLGEAGNWMPAVQIKPGTTTKETAYYDPDESLEPFKQGVYNPVVKFFEEAKAGKARFSEAILFEAKVNEDGRMASPKICEAMGIKRPYRLHRIIGHENVMARIAEAETEFKTLPAKARAAREAKAALRAKIREGRLKEDGPLFFDDSSVFDGVPVKFDLQQYTEYTPLYAGPFFKQLYLYDYLSMHARAFEEWNHNPLAKRIINILSQYSLGRGYKMNTKDDATQAAWDKFSDSIDLPRRMRYWVRERLLYGEIMLDKLTWQSIDPSTIWDIITDADDISKVYYYHQQYSTAYFQFTGKQVPGVPGSATTKPVEYIVRQLPFDQVIHLKGECVSNEKRGRSVLFPVLGWLKRIKDLYNAEVIRAQLQASFIFDDTIKGSSDDVAAHAQKYSGMPAPASVFAHNEAVERKPMPILPHSSSAAGGIGPEILSFVASAVGVPKEFFNVSGQGSRATALVGSEPFAKVVEELQMEFEELLHEIAKIELPRMGVQYKRENIEFTFPSVTKDTTTEMIKNITLSESMGYVSKRTAGTMVAAELQITNYDFEEEQQTMSQDKAEGLEQLGDVPPPAGRMGGSPSNQGNPDGVVSDDESPIHGQGKEDLKDQLNTI